MRLSEAMPDQIIVRVAREEKRQIVQIARQRGVTISEVVREAVQQVAA